MHLSSSSSWIRNVDSCLVLITSFHLFLCEWAEFLEFPDQLANGMFAIMTSILYSCWSMHAYLRSGSAIVKLFLTLIRPACWRKRRAQIEWNVPIRSCSLSSRPSNSLDSKRVFISRAALFVNVTTTICLGSTRFSRTSQATREVNTKSNGVNVKRLSSFALFYLLFSLNLDQPGFVVFLFLHWLHRVVLDWASSWTGTPFCLLA